MQQSEGGGFTASNNFGVSNARGVSDFLTRSTSILAISFFCTSMFLALITNCLQN